MTIPAAAQPSLGACLLHKVESEIWRVITLLSTRIFISMETYGSRHFFSFNLIWQDLGRDSMNLIYEPPPSFARFQIWQLLMLVVFEWLHTFPINLETHQESKSFVVFLFVFGTL